MAVTADIHQMFNCFVVCVDHRNFLCFLWCGNIPPLAVAIIGLRKAAQKCETQEGQQVKHFIKRLFYIDDGHKSVPTVVEANSLLKHTQELLAASNLWLQKIIAKQ